MKPKTMMLLPALILIVLFIIGWLILRTGPAEQPPTTVPVEVFEPAWYAVQDDPEHVFVHSKVEADNQVLAEAEAENLVLEESPRAIEIYILDLMAEVIEEVETLSSSQLELIDYMANQLAHQDYPQAAITELESFMTEENTFMAYVRREIPFSEIHERIVEFVREDEELYNELENSETFQQLERGEYTHSV